MDCEILYPTLIYNNEKKTFLDEGHLFVANISEAGISMHSDFFIPVDSFVSFYFRVEDNLPFKALVKIRWNKAQDGMFTCGGEFIALNLEEIHILRNYVNKHKNQ